MTTPAWHPRRPGPTTPRGPAAPRGRGPAGSGSRVPAASRRDHAAGGCRRAITRAHEAGPRLVVGPWTTAPVAAAIHTRWAIACPWTGIRRRASRSAISRLVMGPWSATIRPINGTAVDLRRAHTFLGQPAPGVRDPGFGQQRYQPAVIGGGDQMEGAAHRPGPHDRAVAQARAIDPGARESPDARAGRVRRRAASVPARR